MSDFTRWTIGKVSITKLPEIEIVIPYNADAPFLPDATPEALARIDGVCPNYITHDGALRMSFHALLVDAPGLRLVVDTCIGNDRAREYLCEEPLQTGFLEDLTAVGWPPDSVDAVLCTHMHVDHVGWNTRLENGAWVPTFPNATYFFSRKEFEHFRSLAGPEHEIVAADSIDPVVDAGLAEYVDSDHRFTNEVSLIPTPGHTPGHVSVLIDSDGARAVISGDTMHNPCQLPRPYWTAVVDDDPARAVATRLSLLENLVAGKDLLIGTHFTSPTAGRVIREGGAFRFLPVTDKSH